MSVNVFWKKEKITSGLNELVSNELSEAIFFSSVFYLTYETIDIVFLLFNPLKKLQMSQKKALDKQQLYYTEPQHTKYFI